MRGTVAKRLSRQAVREVPGGSKLMLRQSGRTDNGHHFWTGTRRQYKELKRKHREGK